jgi:hypothetical protein
MYQQTYTYQYSNLYLRSREEAHLHCQLQHSRYGLQFLHLLIRKEPLLVKAPMLPFPLLLLPSSVRQGASLQVRRLHKLPVVEGLTLSEVLVKAMDVVLEYMDTAEV